VTPNSAFLFSGQWRERPIWSHELPTAYCLLMLDPH
jgi:hypothetical protein